MSCGGDIWLLMCPFNVVQCQAVGQECTGPEQKHSPLLHPFGDWYWLNSIFGKEKSVDDTMVSCLICLRSEKNADLGEWWPLELNTCVSDKLWVMHYTGESAHLEMGTSLGRMTQLCRGGKNIIEPVCEHCLLTQLLATLGMTFSP